MYLCRSAICYIPCNYAGQLLYICISINFADLLICILYFMAVMQIIYSICYDPYKYADINCYLYYIPCNYADQLLSVLHSL